MDKVSGLLTVKAFARIVRRDPFSIYRALWCGRIKGFRRRGRWLIPGHFARKGGENNVPHETRIDRRG